MHQGSGLKRGERCEEAARRLPGETLGKAVNRETMQGEQMQWQGPTWWVERSCCARRKGSQWSNDQKEQRRLTRQSVEVSPNTRTAAAANTGRGRTKARKKACEERIARRASVLQGGVRLIQQLDQREAQAEGTACLIPRALPPGEGSRQYGTQQSPQAKLAS